MNVIAGNAADRLKGAPVEVGIRMTARGIQRSERIGKRLPIVRAIRGPDKRRREQRFFWTCVGRSIRRVGRQHSNRERIDGGVEIAEAGAHAGGSRGAQDLAQQRSRFSLRRPRQSNSRRKAEFSNWRQGLSNAGVAWIEDARRRTGKDHRLRSGYEGRNLVVAFGPGRNAVPAQTVVYRQIMACTPAILRK